MKSLYVYPGSFRLNRIGFPDFVINMIYVVVFSSLSISLGSVFNYSISPAVFFVAGYMLLALKDYNANLFFTFLAIVGYLLLTAIFHISNLNILEFIKSFLLTAIFFYCYFVSFNTKVLSRMGFRPKVFIKYATVLILSFEMLQVFEHIIFGTHDLWFILDDYSISTAVDIGRFEAVNFLGFIRPVSFFHEPSYLAFALFMLFVFNRLLGGGKLVSALLLFGILLTFSVTIGFFLLLYLAIDILKKNMVIVFLMMGCLIIGLLFYSDGIYELFRLNELFFPGTSGHERITKPLIVTGGYLLNVPFGLPLGQSETVFNNSFFLFFLYFGVSLSALLPLLIIFIYNCVGKVKYVLDYLVLVGSLLFLSGAIFTIESAFMLILINYMFSKHRLDCA